MKKLITLFLILAACFAQAQIAPNIYWVQFTDKNDSPFSIDAPEAFLSERALDRRARLGIAIDEYDIPVNPQYLQAVADCGVELLNPSKWLNGVSVQCTNPALMESVNALPFVSEVRYCANDPQAQVWKERWMENEMKAVEGTRATYGYYGEGATQIMQLNGHLLHDSGYQGEGIWIAVLDGGFMGAEDHPCFDNMKAEGRLLGTRSFLPGHPSVYTQSRHGCSCLSTMAAYVPNTFVGTAPKASYYLMHTENGDYENIVEEYNWVSGAEFADSLGIDVCSTSLGYIDFDMSNWDHPFEHYDGATAPMSIGAEIAASRGLICLNAAGNNGYDYSIPCTLGIPADAEHIITVGAVDVNGERAYFSSFGPTYDGRIKPDVMSLGEDTYVAGYGTYYHGNGTSFATPVMAGMVACLRQANISASVQEICDVIRQCGNMANNPDSFYGYGIPDFSQAFDILRVEETVVPEGDIITAYPNPSKGNVRIGLKGGSPVEVSVYDIMGRQMKTYHFNGLNHTTLDNYLNGLSSGVYFVKAVSEMGSQTLKLVISK